MADGPHVDPVSAEGGTDLPRRPGDVLRVVDPGAPDPVGTGDDTPIFSELLARLAADGAGQAALRVLRAGQVYADDDHVPGRR